MHKLDPAAPALVLAVLPRGVLERMLAYAENYRPGAMKTKCGLPPAPGRRRATMDRSEFHRGPRRPWHPAQAGPRRATCLISLALRRKTIRVSRALEVPSEDERWYRYAPGEKPWRESSSPRPG